MDLDSDPSGLARTLLRIIGVRKGAGHFLDEPNNVYMMIREKLRVKQTTINDLFWCEDPQVFLVQVLEVSF